MKNKAIAETFYRIAKILQIKGDNPFRIRAYEKAALSIENLSEDIDTYIKEDKLQSIEGIGKDLADKIKEIAATGGLKDYEKLKKGIPDGVLELLDIPGLGPKTAKMLYDKLKIRSIEQLQRAIEEGRLQGLAKIKEKTIENIKRGIGIVRAGKERMLLSEASMLAEEILNSLKRVSGIKEISICGSLRRQKETIRDIDILVLSRKGAEPKIMDKFVSLPQVRSVIAKGHTRSSILTKEGWQVDLRVVEAKSWGAALIYFTGSKNFNVRLRQLAIKKGLKVSEYGVFKADRYLCGKDEKEVFAKLGLPYIVPELREDRGEIELSLKGQLPTLVDLGDIKGDLHVHSTYSDGQNSIPELLEAARRRGYSYIALTDHSQGLKVAGGLSVAELKKKRREINRLNSRLKGIRVLYGSEVDIDSEGNLDYKDEILARMDIVVAAIHSGFKQSSRQLTRRIIKACQNKNVHIIAHPTGRLRGVRQAYEIDFEKILRVARDTNTYLEINAFPSRLDLNDLNARLAKEQGVKLAIGTDAHSLSQLDAIKFGVAVARRAWLEKKDVINTLPLEKLLKALKK